MDSTCIIRGRQSYQLRPFINGNVLTLDGDITALITMAGIDGIALDNHFAGSNLDIHAININIAIKLGGITGVHGIRRFTGKGHPFKVFLGDAGVHTGNDNLVILASAHINRDFCSCR